MERRKHDILLPFKLDSEELSAVHAIKNTNPGFATHNAGYTQNCQRCVAAYELRRRGYQVIAKPRVFNKPDLLPYMNSLWGWTHVYKNQKLESCRADTWELAKQNVEACMKSYGNHSRAIVKVDWITQNRSHLFMAENQDNKIYYVDPQTGELDVSWYFQYINPHSVVLMRSDQTEFTELIRECFEVPVCKQKEYFR